MDEYRASYKRNTRTTSIYAVWDDHAVANNFDRTHPRLPAGRQAFLEYWPIRPVPTEPARLYRSFRWGRLVEIFILDTRQYRSAASERESAGKTMLGVAQKEWLKRELQRSDAVFKVIATSVPLKYHGPDSWESYTTERQELVNFITQNSIRRVGEPETEFSFNSSFTFGLVRETAVPPSLVLEIYDVEGRLLHRTTVLPLASPPSSFRNPRNRKLKDCFTTVPVV